MAAFGTFELVVAVVVGAGVLLAAVVKTWQFLRRIGRFLDVFLGAPATRWKEAEPGIPERLAVVESRTEQLVHNGGTSMKDTVTRIESTLDEHIAQCPPPRRDWLGRQGGA
jgi:hypothetical protein